MIRKTLASEAPKIYPTAGAVFSDGSLLEIVRRNASYELELLAWNGSTFEVGSTAAHAGKLYSPGIGADASVLARLILPSRAAPHVSIKKLFTSMCERFSAHTTVSDEAARLLAYFAIASWFPDSLFIAPCLSLASPAPVELIAVLQLLSACCRHAILLGEVSPLGLHELPWPLQITMLVNQTGMSAKTQRFLNSCSYRGVPVYRNGQLKDLFGLNVVAGNTHANLLENAIQIDIPPRCGGLPAVLDDKTQRQLVAEFQPKLLMYRLKNFRKIAASKFDVPHFTSPTREIARALGMCIIDNKLRAELVGLLEEQDASTRAERSTDLRAVVLEALLVLCHEHKESVYVKEVRDMVNAILRDRGERGDLTYRAVGAQLKALRLFTKKLDKFGRGINLRESIRKKIHRFAVEYGGLSVEQGQQCCPDAYME